MITRAKNGQVPGLDHETYVVSGKYKNGRRYTAYTKDRGEAIRHGDELWAGGRFKYLGIWRPAGYRAATVKEYGE